MGPARGMQSVRKGSLCAGQRPGQTSVSSCSSTGSNSGSSSVSDSVFDSVSARPGAVEEAVFSGLSEETHLPIITQRIELSDVQVDRITQ